MAWYCWASEASPTLGCSIEISRDIYMYICCRYVVCRMSVVCQIKCIGGITWPTRMLEKEAEKKRSLRNEKLKADRTSETEEQR